MHNLPEPLQAVAHVAYVTDWRIKRIVNIRAMRGDEPTRATLHAPSTPVNATSARTLERRPPQEP